MWPDRVSNPGPLTCDSGALLTVLRGPSLLQEESNQPEALAKMKYSNCKNIFYIYVNLFASL